jgi:hypothetical protein
MLLIESEKYGNEQTNMYFLKELQEGEEKESRRTEDSSR